MNHSFDIDVAAEVGVEAAIIMANIEHWVKRNTANGDNVREGKAWVYNSRAAWCEIFPYLGEKQIRNALERLLAAGFVVRENYSFGSVNRTYWYGLGERAKPCGPKGPNIGSGQKGQTKTVEKPVINSTDTSVSPQPTKASRRANPGIRLEQFLGNANGVPPIEFGEWAFSELGWDVSRISFEWRDFIDYWTSGNAAGGGLKRDWPATWRSHCRRASHRGGSRTSGGGADRGLAAAVRSSMAQRNGATRPRGGLDTGEASASSAEDNTGPIRGGIPAGEIPF